MIVIRLQGGLGNQMFQYAYGLSLARRGVGDVVYDTSSFASDRVRNLALDQWGLELPLLSESDAMRLPRRFGGLGWQSWLAGKRPLEKVSERPLGFHPRHLTPPDHSLLCGYWQDERFFEGAEDELRRCFRPTRELAAESLATIAKMESCNSVAVHVRRTDYVNNPPMRSCDDGYQARCVRRLAASQPGLTAFVFSDDLAWCREHLGLPCPTYYVGHTTPDRAYEDLWMMSRCRHFVIPNSTFGWWSAWLGEPGGGIVFAPRPWFAAPDLRSASVVPGRWGTEPGGAWVATGAVA
jgi:hypothetical protein